MVICMVGFLGMILPAERHDLIFYEEVYSILQDRLGAQESKEFIWARWVGSRY